MVDIVARSNKTMNTLTKKYKKQLICVTSRRSKENHENLLIENLNNLSKRNSYAGYILVI